jgi:hypothetical protein
VQLGTALLMAAVGCAQVLDLDTYSFSGEGGTDGSAGRASRFPTAVRWPGDLSNGAGASAGPTDLSDAGSLSPGDEPDSGRSGPDGGDAGATPDLDPSACASRERCVPPVPSGWQGPLAVGASGGRACPPEYPASFGDLNTGLQVGSAFCVCGCSVDLVTCTLPPTAGGDIAPASCGSPNFSRECFQVTAVPSCSTQPTGDVQPSFWQSTQLACGQAIAFGACGDGTCYPNPDSFGPLCIAALGEQRCPAAFPHGQLYHRGLSDTRSCGGNCACSTSGAACQLLYTFCSPFGEFPQQLANEGEQVCLEPDVSLSIDGLGVVNNGSCTADGAVLEGAVTPADPVTVCCLE